MDSALNRISCEKNRLVRSPYLGGLSLSGFMDPAGSALWICHFTYIMLYCNIVVLE